jgi:hypothetical protein
MGADRHATIVAHIGRRNLLGAGGPAGVNRPARRLLRHYLDRPVPDRVNLKALIGTGFEDRRPAMCLRIYRDAFAGIYLEYAAIVCPFKDGFLVHRDGPEALTTVTVIGLTFATAFRARCGGGRGRRFSGYRHCMCVNDDSWMHSRDGLCHRLCAGLLRFRDRFGVAPGRPTDASPDEKADNTDGDRTPPTLPPRCFGRRRRAENLGSWCRWRG